MKGYAFHPEAQRELQEAIDYYDGKEPGLGSEFLGQIGATIQLIMNFPTAWPKRFANVRRCPLKRFPYGLLFRVTDDVVEIVAVMHDRRRPDYWKGR